MAAVDTAAAAAVGCGGAKRALQAFRMDVQRWIWPADKVAEVGHFL